MPPRPLQTPPSRLTRPKPVAHNPRPQVGAHRQTNSYTTPLTKSGDPSTVLTSAKDPSKRNRYQNAAKRPGTPANVPCKPPNRPVPLVPTASDTTLSSSGFESLRMAELRDQYNQTPSPERPTPRPGRFDAVAEYMSPLRAKQQYQRQQQHLRFRLPAQTTEANTLSPRKLFLNREAAKSQPLIQSNQRTSELKIASREMSRVNEETDKSRVNAAEKGLTPMFFTMQYQRNRSQRILASKDDIHNPRSSLTSVQNQQDHDCDCHERLIPPASEDYGGRVSGIENIKVDKQRVLARKPSIEDKDWIDLGDQQAYDDAGLGLDVKPPDRLPEDFSQNSQTGSVTSQELPTVRRHARKPTSSEANPGHPPLERGSTFPRFVDKFRSQANTKPSLVLPEKQGSKSVGYLKNMSIRSFSWGNNLAKDANKKESGAEIKGCFMKRTGTVLDRVRKFEALGSGMPKDVNNNMRQLSAGYLPLPPPCVGSRDDKPSGFGFNKCCTITKSTLPQYIQGKGKESTSGEISNACVAGQSITQHRHTCVGTEQTSFAGPRDSVELAHRRVSGAKEKLTLLVTKAPPKFNPAEAYKYQNPDGGRFPPWPGSNGVAVPKRSPVKTPASEMSDAKRRKSTSFLPIPTPTVSNRLSTLGSLRSEAPQRIGSHIYSPIPNIDPLEWRRATAYWAGRYSTVRDTMRQQIMDNPRVKPEIVCWEEWHPAFVQAVFRRLYASVNDSPNGDGYSEAELLALAEYQKSTMRKVEIAARITK